MAISQTSRPWLALAAVVIAAGALAGCGVRGPLDPPAQAKAEGEAKSAEAGAAGENSAAPPKPHEPFVLDGLLR
ncbi:MAG: lipoprotein [Hyphomicrobium sp.]|jgi:predicted small lipoprotein YifL|nr:lipoprotein [Hyphomicrobium sp.]